MDHGRATKNGRSIREGHGTRSTMGNMGKQATVTVGGPRQDSRRAVSCPPIPHGSTTIISSCSYRRADPVWLPGRTPGGRTPSSRCGGFLYDFTLDRHRVQSGTMASSRLEAASSRTELHVTSISCMPRLVESCRLARLRNRAQKESQRLAGRLACFSSECQAQA